MRAIGRLGAIACAAAFAGGVAAHPKVGDPVPHFTVRTFDGQAMDSAQLRGQVVIINRWAVWCGPCKKELPDLDAFYRQHAKDGLRIFAVTVDDTLPDSRLAPLSHALAFPLAHAVKGPFPQTEGVPTNYVIDRKGVVRYVQAGAFDQASLDAIIGPLLAEPPPSPVIVTAD